MFKVIHRVYSLRVIHPLHKNGLKLTSPSASVGFCSCVTLVKGMVALCF